MEIKDIDLYGQCQTRAEMFVLIAKNMKRVGLIENEIEFIQALNERETESTTGLIDGFAIPHGQSGTVNEGGAIYIRNASGIEWNSLDGSLVTDIFALCIPEKGGDHLDNLVAISTALMDDSRRIALRNLDNKEDIVALFK